MTEDISCRQRSQNTREIPREPGTLIHDFGHGVRAESKAEFVIEPTRLRRGEPYPNSPRDTVTLYAGMSVGEWQACQRAWVEWRRRGRRAPR